MTVGELPPDMPIASARRTALVMVLGWVVVLGPVFLIGWLA